MVKEKQKPTVATIDKPLWEEIDRDNLPISTRQRGTGVYGKLVKEIAKQPKAKFYKIKTENLGVKSTKLKSIYPSLEKELQRLARACMSKADWEITARKTVNSKDGKPRTYVSHTKYAEWKDKNLRIRIINNEIYLEKMTDKQLP